MRTAPGAWSLGGIVLLAVVSLPHLRAGGVVAPNNLQGSLEAQTAIQPSQNGNADQAVAKDNNTFELRVVGPDGKPIPNAKVELYAVPNPTAEQIRQGKFLKKGTTGISVETDAEGRLVVQLPRAPDFFDAYITIPGYGPYWAGWSSESHVQPIPSRLTAELEEAWSVGGIIVDGTGKPVEGATVLTNIEFKKRPGQTQQLAFDPRLKTDAAGKWRFDSMPRSMGEVYVGIDHPNFRNDDVPTGNYSLSARYQRGQAIVLRNHRFSVSAANGDLATLPVDLGVLTLEKH
jgi:hypothetical protein